MIYNEHILYIHHTVYNVYIHLSYKQYTIYDIHIYIYYTYAIQYTIYDIPTLYL